MEEELQVLTKDIVDTKKWYYKVTNIFCCGLGLGSLFNLCIAAIINLKITDNTRRIFLLWQSVPLNVWISILSLILFLIFSYYFTLRRKDEGI